VDPARIVAISGENARRYDALDGLPQVDPQAREAVTDVVVVVETKTQDALVHECLADGLSDDEGT